MRLIYVFGRCRFLFAVLLCLAFVGPVRLKPGYENARENSEIFAGALFRELRVY